VVVGVATRHILVRGREFPGRRSGLAPHRIPSEGTPSQAVRVSTQRIPSEGKAHTIQQDGHTIRGTPVAYLVGAGYNSKPTIEEIPSQAVRETT